LEVLTIGLLEPQETKNKTTRNKNMFLII
jgi:hypothetical protein